MSRFGLTPHNRTMSRSCLMVLCLLFLIGCSGEDDDSPEPARAPLGVAVTPLAPGTDPSLAQSYLVTEQAGFQAAQIELEWGNVERYLGVADWSSIEVHAIQARQHGFPVSCELLLIDNQAGPQIPGRLPFDLEGQTWRDESFRIRFTYFARELANRFRPQMTYLWLGREVDAYFAQNVGDIESFRRFLQDCRDSLAVTAPEVKVGTILAYGEARLDGRLALCDSIVRDEHRVGLTVYGRDLEYRQVLGPAETADLIREAVARFPSRRVVLCEVGYPSAGEAGALSQDAFAGELTAILEEPPAPLEAAFWYALHDWYPPPARVWAHRRLAGEDVREEGYRQQLTSLGLQSIVGVPRPAYHTLRRWNLREAGVAKHERIVR